MEKKNWRKINSILREVIDLDAILRAEYLDDLELSDELRNEVESLLDMDDSMGELFPTNALELSSGIFEEESQFDKLQGQKIGIYEIKGELGYGGMGAVYLGERIDGKFEQTVAIKMLKREFNSSEIRRRFKNERKIQAKLKHPNIATLIDAGTTEDGVPYLILEYIKGERITDYCKKKHLKLNQILKLFNKVGDAVSFAHQHLVIHRDLKPSNILITESGEPKLLDFGISKLIDEETEVKNTITNMGAMTPEYASPEQINGKSVSTSTDIYSLGVMLFELLSGHRPFEINNSSKENLFKAIIEDEPKKPSAVLTRTQTDYSKIKKVEIESTPDQFADFKDDGIKTKRISEQRTQELISQTKPQLTRINPKNLMGDLDNIILKALRKEPSRRYRTVEQFTADIWRHLDGMPILAQPSTLSYRVSKFVNRNKVAVIATGLVVFALVAGIVATLWQANVARAERAKAEERFDDVRTLANSFLFEISPKIEALPGSLPARKLLVQRALEYLNSLSKESSDDPELQRELAKAYQKVGDLQGNPYNANIGDIKGALESYEKALDIREKLLENDPNNQDLKYEVAASLGALSDLHFNGGDYDKAVTMNEQAIGLVEQVLEEKPNDYEVRTKLAGLLHGQGIIFFSEGKNKEAVESYSKSQNIYEQLHKEKPDDTKIADTYFSLFVSIGEAQAWDEDFENSAKNLQKGLDLIIPLAKKHPNNQKIQRALMIAYFKRADGYTDVKKFDESSATYRKAIAIAKTISESDEENSQAMRDYAIITKKFAENLAMGGKSLESVEYVKFALTLLKRLSEKDPNNSELLFNVANTEQSIGITYLELKNYDEASKYLRQAEAGLKNVLRINPENTSAVRSAAINSRSIGDLYQELAKTGNKRESLAKSIENYKDALYGFKNLKSEGKLSNEDSDVIAQLEKQIADTENELGK